MNEKTVAFLRRAPKFRKRDIDDINALFHSYIFRRAGSGEIWTTCCRRHEVLPADHEIWNEMHIREPCSPYDNDPILKEMTPCPFCGRQGKVKDLKYTGQRKNLCEYNRFALLRWDGSALWVLCGEAKKTYGEVRDLTGDPSVIPTGQYRFGKEAVEYATKLWYWNTWHDMHRAAYRDFDKKTVDEPFTYDTEEGLGYTVLGADAIRKSPIKYCMSSKFLSHAAPTVRYIHLGFVYPRQVEMLMKAGMEDVVYDLARRGVKHYTVLDWKATDPKKAFRVPRQAVKDFLGLPWNNVPEIGVLEYWKRFNRTEKVSMDLSKEIYDFFKHRCYARKTAQHWGVTLPRLFRYLDNQWHCNMGAACNAWTDYVDMAVKEGLALHRSDVLLPSDLKKRHDAMVEERNRHMAEERRREAERYRKAQEAEKQRQAMERELRGKEYAELREKLERKYAWEADGYRIIIPESEKEIEDEGRILKHCVGGYAQRHVEGKTVILFMRKVRTPNKPWLTIEMWGTELHQIHGYRNEGLYTTKGRFTPDPREKYRSFLDPWLDWVKAGSKRKKDGTPIVPNNKKESAA